jgi:hypothetical protein
LTAKTLSDIKQDMLEARDAARRLHALGLTSQAEAFEQVAITPGMPDSIEIESLRRWTTQTSGARAYEGSPLTWARIGLVAYDFAKETKGLPVIRKRGVFSREHVYDVMADRMIINPFLEREDLDPKEFPPTILTLVIQNPGVYHPELAIEMRRDVPPRRPGHFGVSIDINPLSGGFGNTAFRATRIDNEIRRRLPDGVHLNHSSPNQVESLPSQRFTAILLDAITGSHLTPLLHR